MFKFLLLISLSLVVAVTNGLPITINCDDTQNPEQGYTCILHMTRNQRPASFDDDAPSKSNYEEVSKRNSEISSALNSLYGFHNIKRNPELSSALMSYMKHVCPSKNPNCHVTKILTRFW